MQHVKKIYLYLVSVITLIIWVWGAIMLVNMALKTWVFPKADNFSYYTAPSKVDCERQISDNASDPKMYVDRACTDPDYEAKMEQQAKDERSAQKQRDAAQALAMMIIAGPVWYLHWSWAKKEK